VSAAVSQHMTGANKRGTTTGVYCLQKASLVQEKKGRATETIGIIMTIKTCKGLLSCKLSV